MPFQSIALLDEVPWRGDILQIKKSLLNTAFDFGKSGDKSEKARIMFTHCLN